MKSKLPLSEINRHWLLLVFCLTMIAAQAQPPCNAQFYFVAGDSTNSVYFLPSPNPPAATFLWNIGDGNTSTSAVIKHTYTVQGKYYVCLTVTDSLAACTDTHCDSVTVP